VGTRTRLCSHLAQAANRPKILGSLQGPLHFDDRALCYQLFTLLKSHVGRSIKDIGGLDLAHTPQGRRIRLSKNNRSQLSDNRDKLRTTAPAEQHVRGACALIVPRRRHNTHVRSTCFRVRATSGMAVAQYGFQRRCNMRNAKILSAAILLSSCLAWVSCDDRNDRTTSPGGATSGDRGAGGSPQGPSGPREPQKNNSR
jgi:hypothetical protein